MPVTRPAPLGTQPTIKIGTQPTGTITRPVPTFNTPALTTGTQPTGKVTRPVPVETDNSLVQPFEPVKSWEQMGFGEKLWRTAKELPSVLYSFVPEAHREIFEAKKILSPIEGLTKIVTGVGQFGKGIAQVTAQSLVGAGLTAKQAFTKKPESVNIPVLGEISSYQKQADDLQKQGFSEKESKMLVGINAYLGAVPFISRGFRTKAFETAVKKITTKEVPITKIPGKIKEIIAQKKIVTPKMAQETGRIQIPVITKIQELIGDTAEQQKLHSMFEEHLDKFFEGRQKLLGREDPLNRALLKLNNEELKNYSNITQGISSAVKPSKNLKNAVDLWKKINKEEEMDLISRGKLTPEQVENRRWKPVETITGRSRDELKTIGVEPIYYPYLAEDLLKKSDFIATTGRRTIGGYLKRFTGKMLQEDSYIKNPKIAIPRHRMQVFRDKMNEELVDSIKENFAETNKNIIKAYKNNPSFAEEMGVAEWKPAGRLRFYPIKEGDITKAMGVTKKVESYWIPKIVAKELEKFYKPGIIEKTLRMTYDPLIDLWRVSVLNLVPRWLYNNVFGNSMLYALGKGDPLALLFKAPKEMFARTKLGEKFGVKKTEIPKGVFMKEYTGGAEIAKAGQLGSLAREQTQFLRPIENWLNLLEQAKNYRALRIPAIATQNLIKAYVALGQPVGYLNKVAENWFRAALYITKRDGKFLGLNLDKPIPPIEGVSYVNKFLFDYSNLSRAERATFRRVLPFWNWEKNIAKFALEMPADYPTRGLIVGALLQDYVDYINEVNQAEDKTKSTLRIKTDMVYEGKPLYLNLKSAIPFSDVFVIIPTDFHTMGRILTSNPISKIIIERGFRINSFTGVPFTAPTAMQEYDIYGKPILPLPSLRRHLGMQLPQVKMGEQLKDYLQYGTPLQRYETGVPKIYRSKAETTDLFMTIFGYFGIKLSAVEYNEIQKSLERKQKKQIPAENRYTRQLEQALERLKNTTQ